MAARFSLILYSLFVTALLFHSCSKELSCEKCNNKYPFAIAGNDTSFSLPANPIVLNGSASFDTDGKINSFEWTKIDGPVDLRIDNADSSVATISNFSAGVFLLQLRVTDDGGLSSTDTVFILAKDPAEINLPPVANAGPDQEIIFPINGVLLKGSASTDPNYNIKNYTWSLISGPLTFYMPGPHSVNSLVQDMKEGVYTFQLLVEDEEGLFSTDTVVVTVRAGRVCNNLNVRLVPAGKISIARFYPTVAAAGDKIIYAGGYGLSGLSSRVDIYDTKTNEWKIAELSSARTYVSAVTAGDKVYFAGGIGEGEKPSAIVDIYDIKRNEWSAANLSQPRFFITTVFIGGKIIFAGGSDDATSGRCSDRVDILDLSSNSWATATLSQAGYGLTPLVVNDKVYFTGGDYNCRRQGMDIYDATSNTWTTSRLKEPKFYLTAIVADEKMYWAGGYQANHLPSNKVEIIDVNNNNISFTEMCDEVAGFKAKALLHENKILFFSGDGLNPIKFNAFDIQTREWYRGYFDKQLLGAEIITVNNTIFIAGGTVNGTLSDQVWKLEY